MLTKVFILLCALAAIMAYPYEGVFSDKPVAYEPVPSERVRREVELQGGGGGSEKQGFDVKIDGRAPVWQSDDGRHQFDVTAGYSQHLGGPYGNGPADKRIGGVYTFRF